MQKHKATELANLDLNFDDEEIIDITESLK